MRGWIADQEAHGHFRVKMVLAFKILLGIKRQSINPRFKGRTRSEQLRNPAVFVGNAFACKNKEARSGPTLQSHRDPLRRAAFGGIENVCTNPDHALSNFSMRRRVILFCSSAAARSSRSGELDKRDRKNASISSALFPLAHTMKM